MNKLKKGVSLNTLAEGITNLCKSVEINGPKNGAKMAQKSNFAQFCSSFFDFFFAWQSANHSNLFTFITQFCFYLMLFCVSIVFSFPLSLSLFCFTCVNKNEPSFVFDTPDIPYLIFDIFFKISAYFVKYN